MTVFDLNQGAIAPVADEVDVVPNQFPVDGHIPEDLDGLLLRNGPNPPGGRFAGTSMLDWWTGPGMVHGLAISGGRVGWYRNRWTRPSTGNANVNVIGFGGRILALGEGDRPVEIDRTLATVGQTTFGRRLVNGMTAHPKIDPITGRLRFFRADWQPPYLVVGAIDPDNQVTDLREVELDRPVMMHDFAITPRFDVVLDLNVGLDLSLLGRGSPLPLRWQDDHPTRLGLIPCDGSTPRWFDIEPCFIQHVVNAYDVAIQGPRCVQTGAESDSPPTVGPDRTERVVLVAVRYPRFLEFDDRRGVHRPNPLGVLWRYDLDLRSGTVTETALDDRNVELPRIDERFMGQPISSAFAVDQPSDREMRGLRRYDLSTGRSQVMAVDPGDQNSEAVFVPSGVHEGEGWLLACVYRADTDTSDVVIVDAGQLTAGPVAVIHLPRRIPAGFHGAWIPNPS